MYYIVVLIKYLLIYCYTASDPGHFEICEICEC